MDDVIHIGDTQITVSSPHLVSAAHRPAVTSRRLWWAMLLPRPLRRVPWLWRRAVGLPPAR